MINFYKERDTSVSRSHNFETGVFLSHLSHFDPTKEHHFIAGQRLQKPLEYPHWSSTRP